MEFRHRGIRLTSVAGLVPTNISYYDDEIVNYSQDANSNLKLKTVMGYGQHRLEVDGRTVSDYAVHLLEKLTELGRVSPEQIDALVVVTQTPDYVIPPTSCVIHGRLGLRSSAYCVDINDGCAGYIKGLNEACMLLNSTEAQTAVIVAGDILSPQVSKYDRNSFPLVGDAVTVSVISKTSADEAVHIDLHTDGRNHDKLMIAAGGRRLPSSSRTKEMVTDDEGNTRSLEHLCMDGRDVFAFTQTVVPDSVNDFLARRGTKIADYARLYFHQANSFIIGRLRRKFGADETTMPDNVVREYGNSSSGTIPMLIASESSSEDRLCLLVGFGVGLQWGVAETVVGKDVAAGVMEY